MITTTQIWSGWPYGLWQPVYPSYPKETGKQKEERLAKEQMYASWKLFNKKQEKIVEVIQICKPRHKVYHF